MTSPHEAPEDTGVDGYSLIIVRAEVNRRAIQLSDGVEDEDSPIWKGFDSALKRFEETVEAAVRAQVHEDIRRLVEAATEIVEWDSVGGTWPHEEAGLCTICDQPAPCNFSRLRAALESFKAVGGE